jgi:hypothetical protein
MKYIKLYETFINESVMSAKQVTDYIKDLTPEDSDHPDYTIKQIKQSKKNFELKTLKIADILKMDKYVNDYVKSGEVRYGEGGESTYEPYDDELDQPIVIFDNEVVDGYSRLSTLHKRKVNTIQAWVSQ